MRTPYPVRRTQADTGSRLRPVTHQLLLFCVTSLCCIFGIFAFSGVTWIVPLYAPVAYAILLFVLLTVAHLWHDWLNPLFLICAIGFFRFSIPGLLLLFGIQPDIPLLQTMDFGRSDWLFGHLLGLLGLFGVITGWLFSATRLREMGPRTLVRPSIGFSPGVPYASVLGMLV